MYHFGFGHFFVIFALHCSFVTLIITRSLSNYSEVSPIVTFAFIADKQCVGSKMMLQIILKPRSGRLFEAAPLRVSWRTSPGEATAHWQEIDDSWRRNFRNLMLDHQQQIPNTPYLHSYDDSVSV